MRVNVPEKPGLDGLEQEWMKRWEDQGTYRFDRSRTREEIYSVDTPPPTVSGSLHIGHVMSYVHTDIIVRYQRMRGREVFYPMGWDDNGLPTERRVQNVFGVRCDPTLAYDPDFREQRGAKEIVSISRPNFIELCMRLTAEDERIMEDLWRRVGLSVDWTHTYSTIDERSRRASQRSFLRLLHRGLAYQAEAPTLWDVDFRTAVAQAELEDREIPGAYHRVRLYPANGEPLEIETTRPELIPACVAVVAHPSDDRYKALVGSKVSTPLFGSEIPVLSHHLADPEKGTGIAMICTFGDVTDVTWWRELRLPVRNVLNDNGTLRHVTWGEPGWEAADPRKAQSAYDALQGLSVKKARSAIVGMLRDSGDLVGEPKAITHPVKFFEKGDRPLEIITSRQWFIRTMDSRDEILARGRELKWHPEFMRIRFENWVNGLTGDWCISRQRFYGVPFPLWYRIGDDGRIDHSDPLVPDENRLPVDPSTDAPDGFTEERRGKPGGFTGDPDVFDTWATSALTPHIAGAWEDDNDLFHRIFPMDLRSQAHEIIRTWLFVTVVRSHFENGALPWSNAAISGFVVDPDRKKMSKSKGNVVVPVDYLDRYTADGVRYWAGGIRPGMDTVEDEGQMRIGRRLAIKILNASKFVLSRLGESGPVTEALDRSMLAELAGVVDEATRFFDDYDYSRALERTESFFWRFCDDYLELVKGRAYGGYGKEGEASANAALTLALSTLLRLFAPFLPYSTEEVWSWWQEGSIHRTPWPESNELRAASGGRDGQVLAVTGEVLSGIRKVKTAAKVSLKTEVKSVVVRDTRERLSLLKEAEADLRHAGNVADLDLQEGSEFGVEVTL